MSAPLTPERRAEIAMRLGPIMMLVTNFGNTEYGCGEWEKEDGIAYTELVDESLAARDALLVAIDDRIRKAERDLSDVMGLLQRRLMPEGTPPAGTVVTLADWITQSALLRITENEKDAQRWRNIRERITPEVVTLVDRSIIRNMRERPRPHEYVALRDILRAIAANAPADGGAA